MLSLTTVYLPPIFAHGGQAPRDCGPCARKEGGGWKNLKNSMVFRGPFAFCISIRCTGTAALFSLPTLWPPACTLMRTQPSGIFAKFQFFLAQNLDDSYCFTSILNPAEIKYFPPVFGIAHFAGLCFSIPFFQVSANFEACYVYS